MIKIRYRDPNELSPGLHAAAERNGRSTTVYLLSGLNAAQRRAALRRLRISARRGYGPRLPAPQLALALAADRMRTTVGQAGAVFRSHPAGSTVPVMVISAGAIAFLALSAVSIRVIHPTRDPGPSSVAGAAAPEASVSAGAGPGGPVDAGRLGPGQAGPAGQPSHPAAGSGSSPGALAPATSGPGDGPAASGTSAGNPNPGSTTLAGGTAPTPTPGRTATNPAPAASSSAPAPAASATSSPPSPTPTATKSGLCVNVGALGVCL